MCRHLAYLGPPVTLADLVLHQPHSLVEQSWAPADMRGVGTVNADGFGIGWLVGDPGSGVNGAVARRYRRDRPIWSDASLPDLAASISSGAILAAVRNASPGMPVTETACAPFMEGAWMFSHNGTVAGWPATVAPLADALAPDVLMALDAPTDSAFLWALVRQQLRGGRPAAAVLAEVVGDVLALAPRSRLNLLLHDGLHIAATTVGHALWLHHGEGSVTVSSEVLDPGQSGWQQVPELSLVEATAADHTIHDRAQGWS
jgi:gamma-glutamyl hercynylcysteine S-oxide hydrolase